MLDKQLAAIVAQAHAAGVPDLSDLPPAAARGLYRQILAAADVAPVDVDVRDRTIGGAGGPLYGDRLLAAGNAVTTIEYHGLAHGFISMGGGVSAARLAQQQLAQALRGALR